MMIELLLRRKLSSSFLFRSLVGPNDRDGYITQDHKHYASFYEQRFINVYVPESWEKTVIWCRTKQRKKIQILH